MLNPLFCNEKQYMAVPWDKKKRLLIASSLFDYQL
jgi:hypothetical protein